jgi:hypothetical protein
MNLTLVRRRDACDEETPVHRGTREQWVYGRDYLYFDENGRTSSPSDTSLALVLHKTQWGAKKMIKQALLKNRCTAFCIQHRNNLPKSIFDTKTMLVFLTAKKSRLIRD